MKIEITNPNYLVTLLDLLNLKDIIEINNKYEFHFDIFKIYDGLKYIGNKVNIGENDKIWLEDATLKLIERFIGCQTIDDTIRLMENHNLVTENEEVVQTYDTSLYELYDSIVWYFHNL